MWKPWLNGEKGTSTKSQDHSSGGCVLYVSPARYLCPQVMCVDTCLYYMLAVHGFTCVSQTRLSMSVLECLCVRVRLCEHSVNERVGVEGVAAK